MMTSENRRQNMVNFDHNESGRAHQHNRRETAREQRNRDITISLRPYHLANLDIQIGSFCRGGACWMKKAEDLKQARLVRGAVHRSQIVL